jgi:hypothetical protein
MNKIDLIITALEDRVKDYCTDSYDLDYYSCCSADLEAGHTTDCTLVKALDAARELRDSVEQAVLKEREACAKECWVQMGLIPSQAWSVNPYEQCAKAIRARGKE